MAPGANVRDQEGLEKSQAGIDLAIASKRNGDFVAAGNGAHPSAKRIAVGVVDGRSIEGATLITNADAPDEAVRAERGFDLVAIGAIDRTVRPRHRKRSDA